MTVVLNTADADRTEPDFTLLRARTDAKGHCLDERGADRCRTGPADPVPVRCMQGGAAVFLACRDGARSLFGAGVWEEIDEAFARNGKPLSGRAPRFVPLLRQVIRPTPVPMSVGGVDWSTG